MQIHKCVSTLSMFSSCVQFLLSISSNLFWIKDNTLIRMTMLQLMDLKTLMVLDASFAIHLQELPFIRCFFYKIYSKVICENCYIYIICTRMHIELRGKVTDFPFQPLLGFYYAWRPWFLIPTIYNSSTMKI